MLTGDAITYRQLIHACAADIVWVRIYWPASMNRSPSEYHGALEIRESVYANGDRIVSRAQPGYYFLIVCVE